MSKWKITRSLGWTLTLAKTCADKARTTITAYASVFWGEVEELYAPGDKTEITATIQAARKTVGGLPRQAPPGKYKESGDRFIAAIRAAFAACDPKHHAAARMAAIAILDRLKDLLGKLDG